MQPLVTDVSILGAILGGWETVLILAIFVILFGAKHLPNLARGFGEGVDEFGKASRDVAREIDQQAFDAGQSAGGIYGKPAAEALTPDNQTAELYDPQALSDKKERKGLCEPSCK